MNFSLTFSLTVALAILSYLRDSLSHSIFQGQVSDKKKPAIPEKQLPVETRLQASGWACRLGLLPCLTWVRYRVGRVIIGEVSKEQAKGLEQEAFKGAYWPGFSKYPIRTWKSVSKMVLRQEQQPVYSEKQASDCTCRLGLFSCLKCIHYRISKAVVTEGPKQQPLELTQKTFKGPWWLPRIQERVSKTVFPEKQLPVDAEHQASNWPRCLGLFPRPRSVRHRVSRDVTGEVPKQEAKGTKQEAFKGTYQHGLSAYPTRIWKSVSRMVLRQEQQPVDTKKQAADCTCRLGLFSCLKCIQYRISRAVVTEGPRQPLELTQKTFKGPWWLSMIQERARKTVFPEKQLGEKKLPVNAEHQESSWSLSLGLSAFPIWVQNRVSRIIITEGMELKLFTLSFPLDPVWDYFAQGALVRLFLEGLFIIVFWHLMRVAQGLWRKAERP